MSVATKRINISMDTAQIERIDRYAEEMCLNRSSAITVLTSQALEYRELLSRLPEILDLMKSGKGENAAS